MVDRGNNLAPDFIEEFFDVAASQNVIGLADTRAAIHRPENLHRLERRFTRILTRERTRKPLKRRASVRCLEKASNSASIYAALTAATLMNARMSALITSA
jgi:hypothetical protein